MRIITFLILLLLRTANGQSNSSSTESVTSSLTTPTVTQFLGMVITANVVVGGSVWCATNRPACALGATALLAAANKAMTYCRSSPETRVVCRTVKRLTMDNLKLHNLILSQNGQNARMVGMNIPSSYSDDTSQGHTCSGDWSTC